VLSLKIKIQMLIGVFKSNQKLVNALVVLTTILLWMPSFFMDRSEVFTSTISAGYLWVDAIITVVLVATQAIYINMIVNEYKLVENNTHLTGLMFVLLNSCFLELFKLNEVLIANTFVLLGIHQLLRLYGTKGDYALSFNAGFLLAIATVIYSPNGIFLFFLWFGIMYMLSAKWRDFMVSLIGFSIPILYVACYNFVFKDFLSFGWLSSSAEVFNFSWIELSRSVKILVFMILGVFFLSLPSLFARLSSGALRTRKMLVLIGCFFFFGLATLFFNQVDYLASFVVLTIPVSVVVANFFQKLKKQWLSELLFMALLIVIIVGYFS